jgi:hypothetical protein
MQTVCGFLTLLTALVWWKSGTRYSKRRVLLAFFALLTVVGGWIISGYVSELRLERYSPDAGAASAAKSLFGVWHLVSLGLSVVTVGTAGVLLGLTAFLPLQKSVSTNLN